ncbi:MAG: hypothetical protein EHM28_13790 [Spirochaetaceae bacterium]|nr:MAG: hypothetical protein EHM28_13790 [Spirochaetaceae bacterium]
MAEGKRPVTATIAAIIEIVFGGIGAFISLFALIGSFGMIALAGLTGIFSLVLALGGMAVCVIGLIAGIGLLTNKKNGMSLSPIWVWGTVVLFALGIVSSIIGVTAITSSSSGMMGDLSRAATELRGVGTDLGSAELNKAAAELAQAAQASSSAAGDFGIAAVIGGAIGGLFWQVAPAIAVLILLGMKPVKEFYAKAA